MTKRELVIKTLEGKEKGSAVPSCFSLHFPKDCAYGEKAVKVHLDFFRETDTDIIKIMNENAFPSCPGIVHTKDYRNLEKATMHSLFIERETDLVKRILDSTDGNSYSLCTIQGATASLVHSMRPQYQALDDIREVQVQLMRENKNAFLDAMKRVTEAQCLMVRSVLEAGADGIFYAVLGGEDYRYTDEEFALVQAPFDKEIMNVAKECGKTVVLHMCKKHLAFHRFESYAPYCDAVNWGVYENNISLEEGIKMFPGKTIIGGLENRSGIIVDATIEGLKDEVRRLKKEMEGHSFILGADCTLSSDIDTARVRAAVEAARE